MQITITIRDGRVEQIFSNVPVVARVIDYDIDGLPADELTKVRLSGTEELAFTEIVVGDLVEETDEERLGRFYDRIEAAQLDGEILRCGSCGATIPPDSKADPCFVCGDPLCYFCSISGPRCRVCEALP